MAREPRLQTSTAEARGIVNRSAGGMRETLHVRRVGFCPPGMSATGSCGGEQSGDDGEFFAAAGQHRLILEEWFLERYQNARMESFQVKSSRSSVPADEAMPQQDAASQHADVSGAFYDGPRQQRKFPDDAAVEVYTPLARDFEDSRLRCKTALLYALTGLSLLFIAVFAGMVSLDTRDRISEEVNERKTAVEQCRENFEREGCSDMESVVPAMREFCASMRDCKSMDPHAIQKRAPALLASLFAAFGPLHSSWKLALAVLTALVLHRAMIM